MNWRMRGPRRERRSGQRVPMDRRDPRTVTLDCLEAMSGRRDEPDSGTPIHRVLSDARAQSGLPREQMVLVECWAKGVVQHQTDLDGMLNKHLKDGISSLPLRLGWLLRVATFQLLHLDRIVPAKVVAESVEQAKTFLPQALVSLVNAVLRKIARERPENPSAIAEIVGEPTAASLAAQTNHPEWLVERWITKFGYAGCAELCQINNQPWPLGFRVNTTQTTREALQKILAAEGIAATESKVVPNFLIVQSLPKDRFFNSLESFKSGLFFIQDEASAMIPELVAAQPGEFVIDLCSAPGGKACGMAMMMQNKGQIMALELYRPRVKMILENAQRLKLPMIEAVAVDVLNYVPVKLADRVLLDVPCSGTGTLGRKVDVRWKRLAEELKELVVIQEQLLEKAASMVRPGGRLVYSTCSLEGEENEKQVERFLKKHKKFKVIPAAVPSGWRLGSGMFMQTVPHQTKTAGMFAAVMERGK